LGVFLATGAIKCWKCGKHGEVEVIKALLACDWDRAVEIHRQYEKRGRRAAGEAQTRLKATATVCEYPSFTGPLNSAHRAYLEGRKYDPDLLAEVWGLRGTSNLGDYKFRIIAPITLDGKMVSFQGRDITNQSDMKYKACKKEREVVDHQDVVYGLDQAKRKACVLVEGIADVWRLGPGAVCCFGIAYTMAQVNLLVKKFKTVYIMFDGGETEAAKQARKIALLLSNRGVDVEMLFLDSGDPGEMSQVDADELMRDLYLEGYRNFR
jgi:hypothetical protein